MADSLNQHYLARKIHSLLGVVPVAAFVAFHLWENSMSRHGAEFFNEHVVEGIEELLNYKEIAEITLIGGIFAHVIYGVVIWWQGKSNFLKYKYGANLRYVLQRVTSITTLAFIVWHLWQTRIAVALGNADGHNLFAHMQQLYQDPLIVVLYLIGITGATLHLANGLWLAGITWGITTHPRAQKISLAVCGVIFVVTTALGFHALWGFNKSFF